MYILYILFLGLSSCQFLASPEGIKLEEEAAEIVIEAVEKEFDKTSNK